MKMPDGRMWSELDRGAWTTEVQDPDDEDRHRGDDMPEDNSVMPTPPTKLRDLPPLPSNWKSLMDNRLIFEVKRGAAWR